jgi:hypothetical protein
MFLEGESFAQSCASEFAFTMGIMTMMAVVWHLTGMTNVGISSHVPSSSSQRLLETMHKGVFGNRRHGGMRTGRIVNPGGSLARICGIGGAD